jgi:DNA-binding NtrC family response regulator
MPQELVGQSPQIEKIRGLIRKLAGSPAPVLILGESGTGKEVVARAIHEAGSRRGEFITIDCGTLAGTLVESELFGHAKGAFTGASEVHKGLVEAAGGGTAFFDEIGDLRPDVQVKLLRLLQEHEIRPVGSTKSRTVDIRVMAATNRDLELLVSRGQFREDLFYRLKVVTLRLPPLRERREDIPALIGHFLKHLGPGYRLTPEAMEALLNYQWPGNVRELQNALEQMTALNTGPLLHAADLPSSVQHLAASRRPSAVDRAAEEAADLPVVDLPSKARVPLLRASEEQTIREALARTRGKRGQAAGLLGIGRTTLYRKLKQYKIET